MKNKIKVKNLYRNYQFKMEDIDEDKRTVELTFSSEEPYERWFGMEILDHKPESVRLGRLNNSGVFLVGHNQDDLVGKVESAAIEKKRGKATVRLGNSVRADEIFQDIKDGIRTNVSIGYRVLKMELSEVNSDSPDVYRVIDWEPFEISTVGVPADDTVGVGRESDNEYYDVEIINKFKIEGIKMDPKEKEAIEAKARADAESEAKKVRDNAQAIVEIQTKARDEELNRVRDITTIGVSMKLDTLAKQFIENGKSVGDFREVVLDELEKKEGINKVPENVTDIGLSDVETKQYSFLRVINALANPTDRGAQEAASFEFECSAAAAKHQNKTPQGIMIPSDVLKRALNVGTATAGGNLVQTDLMSGSFIDLLRNRSALMDIATVLNGLDGDIAIPRMTGGATAYWVAEAGVPTTSQQAFDQVSMSPKTVGAYTDYTRKMFLQSSIDVENMLRMDLATVLALEVDRVGVNGSGSGAEPRGIMNTTGIGSVVGGTNGLTPAWSHIVDLESAVANSNADVGSIRYLTNTKVRGKLKQVEKASGTAQFIFDGNGMNGVDTIISNQVPSNLTKGTSSVASAILYGNFADLMIGMWGGLDLKVDPYALATSGGVRVIALQDVDVAVRHPESFSAMLDALTA